MIIHIKLASFLRLIVNSCIAEFDLFKFTCLTKISNLFPRDSVVIVSGLAMSAAFLFVNVGDLKSLLPLQIETLLLFYSGLKAAARSESYCWLYCTYADLCVLYIHNIVFYLNSDLIG